MTPTSEPVPAVVLGATANALGTVKALRRAGIPAIMVGLAPESRHDATSWVPAASRLAAHKVLLPRWDDDHVHETLESLAARWGQPLPILPSSDRQVEFLAERSDALRPHFRFRVPSDEVRALLVDKSTFAGHCTTVGVPVPRTFSSLDTETVDRVAGEARFPMVVKPINRTEAWDRRFSPAKVLVAETAGALRDAVAQAAGAGVPLLGQEVIPGRDDQLFFSHLYLDRNRRLVGAWTGRKIRQLPTHFGTSTLTEACRLPEIVDHSLALVDALEVDGYVSVEFKRDARDGAYYAIEVTLGRTWYPHLLGAAVGVNIPELWYRDLLGESLPEVAGLDHPEGVRWIDEYRDILAALEYRSRGELGIAEWISSYRGVRAFSSLSLREPYLALRLFKAVAMGAFERLRNPDP